jgi:hypothetical protein
MEIFCDAVPVLGTKYIHLYIKVTKGNRAKDKKPISAALLELKCASPTSSIELFI